MHPDVFEDLIEFVTRHFQVTTFREHRNLPGGKPKLVLSFDDGYYDFVEYAMPILERKKISANQNIIPSCVDTGMPIWNVRLYDFLDSAPTSLINEIRLPGFEQRLDGHDEDSKMKYASPQTVPDERRVTSLRLCGGK
jgi:peptidoglycan/xylan/chitin deacetylase (PgdA/CDA1 family)